MPAGVSYMTQRAFFMEKMKNEERKSVGFMDVYLCISYLRVNLKKIPKTSTVSFDFMHFVLLLYVVQSRVF